MRRIARHLVGRPTGNAITMSCNGPLCESEPPPARQVHAVHVVAVPGDQATCPSYPVTRLCESLTQAGAQADLLAVGSAQEEVRGGFRHARFTPDWPFVPVI